MKKIRVTVPEDIWRMMKNDIEEFGINNNKLCNYILEKLKYKKEINIEKDLESQGRPLKKIIQFDLNVSNKEIYYDVLRDNNVEIEAEFFRELFEKYCSKFKYIRELFIFQDTVKNILEAIREKKKLKLKYGSKLTTVEPYFIKRDEQGDENFLFCYCETEKTYYNYKLKDLEVISILEDKIKGKDKKYIESVRKNFDPFLGNGNFVKVKLTENGMKMIKGLTNYRPKLIEKNDNIYIFETSNENAKLYFRQFSKEAIVLEPKELREEMKKDFLEALANYE
ncbi:WYL domain-containing protein [Fusobacterium sp.]|uniref:WYL domain-containing protein n=1 Tax=Fusobacterium sp. TaxID=68766 RepID=UPI00260E04ED|nr:WYL domain-containing protein [Fusobacterium sp.]